MRAVLTPLYRLQHGLDEEIHQLHNESYATTFEKRKLALLVELGELANETRCFKFWSLKGPSPKEKILDEYADGLHFLLSLGVAIGVRRYEAEVETLSIPLHEAILDVYKKSLFFFENECEATYSEAMLSFLELLPLLGYTVEEAIDAYKKKLAVNYERQKEHY